MGIQHTDRRTFKIVRNTSIREKAHVLIHYVVRYSIFNPDYRGASPTT